MNETEELLRYFEKSLPRLYNDAPIRQEQVQLALDVSEFLFHSPKKFLFIDAPVGTGKSMGVLIPTLMYSKKKSKGLLYATATISLQNQIMTEEVPKLKRMKLVEKAILAMGKSNYTCRWHYEDNKSQFSKEKRKKLDAYFKFSMEYTGQLSEIEAKYNLNHSESNLIRIQQGTANKNNRLCRDCIYEDQCNSIRHRKMYRSENHSFDITVTNHDQMIVSQKFVESGGNPIVPMDKGIIIVDEAHLFMENYLGRMQQEIPFGELLHLVGKIDNNLSNKIKKEQKNILGRGDELQGVSEVPGSLKKLLAEGIDRLGRLNIRESMRSNPNDELIDRIEKCEESLQTILSKGYIPWIDIESKKYCAASKKFLSDFGKFLSSIARYNKVIFMSGTLTGTKKKKEIVTQWGVSENDMEFYSYETPFDYSKQAKIYIPTDLAEPKKENDIHLRDVSRRIQRMVEISNGNMLVLCTSKHYMFSISENLKYFFGEKYDILTQNDKSVEMLTNEFKRGQKILVGSGSFFTGFSIAGEALTSVVITKLPFPTPDNPLVKLIGQNLTEEQTFDQVILPMMFNKLYQAVGRLIRDISDYGIISILDPRVHTKLKYGDKVLFRLSDLNYDISDSLLEIHKFYERVSKQGTNAEFVKYDREHLARIPIIDTKKEMRENVRLLLKRAEEQEAREQVVVKEKIIRSQSAQEIKEEQLRKEKIRKIENERRESEKRRNEIRISIKPLEDFRSKWKMQLFTQNQKDQGVEKCFFYTIELIKKKFGTESERIIEDLFNEFPFSDEAEGENYRSKLREQFE